MDVTLIAPNSIALLNKNELKFWQFVTDRFSRKRHTISLPGTKGIWVDATDLCGRYFVFDDKHLFSVQKWVQCINQEAPNISSVVTNSVGHIAICSGSGFSGDPSWCVVHNPASIKLNSLDVARTVATMSPYNASLCRY